MRKTALYRTSLALAVSSVMSHAVLADPVCEGKYLLAMGSARPPITGKVAGVSEPLATVDMRVSVKECGRVLQFDAMDKTINVLRSDDDPTRYAGTWGGDTIINTELVHVVDAPVHIDVLAPDHITGQFLIPGAPDSAIWELTLVDGQSPDFRNCEAAAATDPRTDEDRLAVDPALRAEVINIVADKLSVPREKAGRYISAARTVAKTQSRNDDPTIIAPGEGDCPEEFAGVRECLEFPSDTTTIVEINVLLDKDGRLLPVTTEGSFTNRVRVDDPAAADFCAQETSLPPAEMRLRFKFFAIEDDGINDVQAVLADAETNIAQSAFRAEAAQMGHYGRTQAADEAYQGVGAPVTGLH